MATGYYTELAAEYAWQLVPLLRPKYRFFPGRRREPKKYGRGWYVFDEASGRWKYLDDITWLVLGHLRLRHPGDYGRLSERRPRADAGRSKASKRQSR